MIKNNSRIILIACVLIGIAIVIVGYFVFFNGTSNNETVESVVVVKDGKELVVNSDGSVFYTTLDGTFNDSWNSDKTNAYFNYFSENYDGESQIARPGQDYVTVTINGRTYTYILGNDEIVDAAGEDATQNDNPGSGGSSGGSDDGVNQYFSPAPFPSSRYSPTPVPTPYNGPSFMDECLFWRLSYCVIPKAPSPTAGPSPTGSADPDANVIKVNNCGQYIEEGNTQPTIISNTVCFPEN